MFKCLWVFFIYSISLHAGQEIGNGGGFVRCPDNKYYSYDYVLTTNNSFGIIRSDLNFNQRIQQISQHLHRLADPLAKEFDEFMSILYRQIPRKKFQWLQQKNLSLLWDPDLDRQLPRQCKNRKQAVVYMASSNQVPYSAYYYDLEIINQVQAQLEGDLQVSLLWTHEWLWNHVSRRNFLKLAYFNQLLHSEKLTVITPAEYYNLKNSLLNN